MNEGVPLPEAPTKSRSSLRGRWLSIAVASSLIMTITTAIVIALSVPIAPSDNDAPTDEFIAASAVPDEFCAEVIRYSCFPDLQTEPEAVASEVSADGAGPSDSPPPIPEGGHDAQPRSAAGTAPAPAPVPPLLPAPGPPAYDMEPPVITWRTASVTGCSFLFTVRATDNIGVSGVYGYLPSAGKVSFTNAGGAWSYLHDKPAGEGNLLSVNLIAVDANGNGHLQDVWLVPSDCH